MAALSTISTLTRFAPMCLALVTASAVWATAPALASATDFRNAQWYDSIEKVRSQEKAEFIEHRTKELNTAVEPSKPWAVQHLYFRTQLLGESIRILYRFDLDCKQLYAGAYIFARPLPTRKLKKVVKALEEKYKVSIELEYSEYSEGLSANAALTKRTRVDILQAGMMHFHRDNTVIQYSTRNWSWLGGWKEGTEPTCPEKSEELESLKDSL